MAPKRKKGRNGATKPDMKSINKIETRQVPKPKLILYHCKLCSAKQFKFKERYTKHVRNEHSTLPGAIPCDKCKNVRCPDKATLKQHMAKVHEREIFKCPHCHKEFVRHAHVLRHMAQKGCDGRKNLSLYICEICNASFSRKDNLMVHLRLQHIEKKAFCCKQCVFSSRSFSKLIIHTQHYHLEQPPQYECDHCGKVTSSRAAIAKHLEIHGDKKFACDVCGYSTFTIEVMRRHVLTHVQEKPYKCSDCGRSFIQRSQLHRHLFNRKGPTCQEKVCPDCDEIFGSKSELVIHYRHAHQSGSRKNKEIPPEDRPFKCEVCNKEFRHEIHMRRHVPSHKLERARRCMYCVAARAYVRGMQLVRHVRKAHPVVFREHLVHVRSVLGIQTTGDRVKKSEMESILNVLDAEAERIIDSYGEGVLYGGMQEVDADKQPVEVPVVVKSEYNPLMSEEELTENLKKLLAKLIDLETLELFGWHSESIDVVLERVIEHCGQKPADRDKWSRVQRLRENAKHLFLHVNEDKNLARMLDTHTIDQIIKHILAQVCDNDPDGDGDETEDTY